MWEDDEGMTVVHGRYDPVTGAEIKALLDAETDRLWHLDGGRSGAAEVRSAEQRRADALHELLCRPASDSARVPAGQDRPAHPRTQLIVIAESGVISGLHPHGRCEIPGVGPIPRSELDRLACEAAVFGAIFDGHGSPIWLGRESRLASHDQWRALIARDAGCVLCAAAPIYCQAHHIVAWQPPARGPTDIDNLALLCTRHHHQLHDTGQILTRTGPREWSTEPEEHDLVA